jgi:ribokinase
MTGLVVCLGEVMMDVLASLTGELAIHSDTPASIRLAGGGSAANTASWLAEIGKPVSLVARVGADAFGDLAAAELAAAGVRAHLILDSELPTGSCIVLVSPDGERTMVPDAGANAALTADDLDAGLFRPGRHFHLSAYSLFHGAESAALAALALARASDMTVTIDAASAAPLREFGAQRFREVAGSGALLLANLDEAEVLTGSRDRDRAVLTLAQMFGAAVVKLGSGGSVWSNGSVVEFSAAMPVEVIDSTGAGDAFAAGLIAEFVDGAGPVDYLRAGNELAARACVRVGGRPPR